MTAYLAVAKFRKPHGLKGEAVVFPLTDDPEKVLVPGRELVVLDRSGEPTSKAFAIRKSRAYHRN